MKAFFKKYSLELNLLLTALIVVAASMAWFEFFEEQKGRYLMRGTIFSFFSITRGATVYSLWVKRKQSIKVDYEVLENEKHLE